MWRDVPKVGFVGVSAGSFASWLAPTGFLCGCKLVNDSDPCGSWLASDKAGSHNPRPASVKPTMQNANPRVGVLFIHIKA